MAKVSKKKLQHRRNGPTFAQFLRAESKKNSSKTHTSKIPKKAEKHLPKRDKYGRFVKTNRLGLAKRLPPRQRDKYGRFVSSDRKSLKRGKKGRFVKLAPVWYRRRIVTALAAIIIGTTGAVYFGLQLNKTIAIEDPIAASPASEPVKPANTQVVVAMSKSEPARIRIPKIAVDTSFVQIGLNADGSLEVPKSYDAVGWYNRSPTPGELGPAIVAGHVDRPGGIAVFWRLRELVPGDTLEIDRANGSTARFKVDAVKQVPQSDFPTGEVYGNINFAGIRLITCAGIFDRTARQYSDNLVVFGSLITDNQTTNSSTQ